MSSRLVDDEWVVHTLAECLVGRPNYLSPGEDRVSWLTRRINQFLDCPWDEARVDALLADARAQRSDGKIMQKAADILRRDLAGWRNICADQSEDSWMRLAAEHKIAEHEIAIATLDSRRGPLDQPGLTVKLSERGNRPKPWALMAAGIAEELIRALRSEGDSRAGIGGPDGPVTKFVMKSLTLIMEPNNPPKNSTINEAIENHLENTFDYQRRGYSEG